jgi:methionyl aminopeptidase
VNRLRGSAPCWCGSGRKFKRCHGDQRRLRRPPVTIGTVSPAREVPATIVRPSYVLGSQPSVSPHVEFHSGASLERLRAACRVAAEVLETVGEAVKPGVTTDELDRIAHEAYLSRGAYPSTLGYKGFPKSICTSVNEIICHGIPDDRRLVKGDIVNVDVTAFIEGMHGDTSATFPVGEVDAPAAALIEVTREAMLAGVAAVAPGKPLKAIGQAIQLIAHAHGLGVVYEYGGHGIGTVFHAAPHINHFVEERDHMLFEPGMTFTIEPMLTTGSPSSHIWTDDWTVAAVDLLPSAQFEHTIVVTESGSEILTLTGRGTSPAGTLDAPKVTLEVQ